MTTPLIRPSLVTVPHANVLMGESFASTRAELTLLKNSPHVSVAIVGSGACGLTAALMLKDHGVECVLLERDERPRGSSALSSGFVPAAGTQAQARQAIEDDQAQFVKDIVNKSHGQSALHLVKAYVSAVPQAIDALEARHGVTWRVLDQFLYPGHSTHRMHAVPETSGEGLMSRLERAAQEADLTLLTHAQVTQLFMDPDDRVVGLGFVRPDGSREALRCDAALLACNGYGGDQELVAQYLPQMKAAVYAGHVGNDGTAVRWGQALGVALKDMGAYQGHGSWQNELGLLISWALMVAGGIQINAHGVRFHDEHQGYSEASVGVLAQPGGVAWCVFDQPVYELGLTFPEFKEAQVLGGVKRFESVTALSQWVGCPEETLARTLSAQDRARDQEEGQPEGHSKSIRPLKPLKPPLYAIKVTGALFHTQGGLDIDEYCQVLGDQGTPLPNLWAAGGAARGVSGQEVWGYLSGNGLLSALAGGFIAAESIARAVAHPSTRVD